MLRRPDWVTLVLVFFRCSVASGHGAVSEVGVELADHGGWGGVDGGSSSVVVMIDLASSTEKAAIPRTVAGRAVTSGLAGERIREGVAGFLFTGHIIRPAAKVGQTETYRPVVFLTVGQVELVDRPTNGERVVDCDVAASKARVQLDIRLEVTGRAATTLA